MKFFTKLPFVLILVFATGIVLTSCGGDTDPEVEASNEKFIGDYVGEVACPGVLKAVITDPVLSFTITATSPAQDDMVKVNLPIPNLPIELIGTVSGNSVSMGETTVEDVDAAGIKVDVTASGNATIAGTALSGTMDLVGYAPGGGALLASDKCTITATKQ